MPNFARGPEVEIASVKDVEDLKHQLAQQNIHLDYKVLQRAVIMPKDLDTTGAVYPNVADLLQKNPNAVPKKQKKTGGKHGGKSPKKK